MVQVVNVRASRWTRALLVLLWVFASTVAFAQAHGHASWDAVAKRIATTSQPDSTAVLVLFDQDLCDYLRARLPKKFTVVAFRHPAVPLSDAFEPLQVGRMYRDASTATGPFPEVWVVGRRSDSAARRRAAWFANSAASRFRRRLLLDSLGTLQEKLAFSRWVDQPRGVAQRLDMMRAQAWAESVLAVRASSPKPIPITRPFSSSELYVDPDTLTYYMARLPDTSFYVIGGCSEVEITMWNASEKLGSLGPGVVPPLVGRIDDKNPSVRDRVQEALLYATQDDRILARTGGDYIRCYESAGAAAQDVVKAWWEKYARFWSADSVRLH
jgi:hypothetical protein